MSDTVDFLRERIFLFIPIVVGEEGEIIFISRVGEFFVKVCAIPNFKKIYFHY
jgi:hypothetical protein